MKIRRLVGVVAAAALLLGSMGTVASAAPSNDEEVGATSISSLPYSTVQDLSGATTSVLDPKPSCTGGQAIDATVFFHYTAGEDGRVGFETTEFLSSIDTVLAVYAGALTEVACNDDAGPFTGYSRVEIDAVEGVTYAVMLGVPQGGSTGQVMFSADAVGVSNDEIIGATPVTGLPFSVTQDLGEATAGVYDPEPSCLNDPAEATVWFTYTPAETGRVTFDTLQSPSDTDTVLAVYLGGATVSSEVACNDDVDLYTPIRQSLVTVDVVADQMYTIMLGVYPGRTAGEVTLSADVAGPPNDEVVGATPIAELPFSVTQDLSKATVGLYDPTPSCMPAPAEATVWFTYTPAADGAVRFDTLLSTTDTVLAVYLGGATETSEVACNDDVDVVTPISQSLVTVDVVAGQLYTVMLGVYPGWPAGEVTLRADHVRPPNEITVSIDPLGTVVPTSGEATIRGTVTCSQPTTVSLDVGLSQRRGRTFVDGSGYGEVECDGATPWELTVTGADGLFRRGPAEA
jgi:hypothetical protein